MAICVNELRSCSGRECWKVILILKLKSLCEKWECCFEVRTLVAILEILAHQWEIEEDGCQCVVSLCHGLVPHNLSPIVITCINMMRLIGMIAKWLRNIKHGYYCTKILYWVIVCRLRTNNKFKLRVLIYRGFTVHSMFFP